MRRFLRAPGLILALLAAAPALAGPPKVVADTPVTQSLAAQVMEGIASPELLLPQGATPHDAQLRPSQVRALTEADLILWIGPELTPWLTRALDSAGSGAEAISLLHLPETRRRPVPGGTAIDPHAWLDPANARLWLGEIAARLGATDPDNAARYAANAARAQAALATLEADLRARLAPAAGRPLYSYHDAFGYFAEAFGLNFAGSLAETDAAAPGARRFAELGAELAARPEACLFAEGPETGSAIASLAERSGLPTGMIDPAGTAQDPGPGLYAATLGALAEAILGCREPAG